MKNPKDTLFYRAAGLMPDVKCKKGEFDTDNIGKVTELRYRFEVGEEKVTLYFTRLKPDDKYTPFIKKWHCSCKAFANVGAKYNIVCPEIMAVFAKLVEIYGK